MKGLSRRITKVLLAVGILLVLAECGGTARTTNVSVSMGVGYGGFSHRYGIRLGLGLPTGLSTRSPDWAAHATGRTNNTTHATLESSWFFASKG